MINYQGNALERKSMEVVFMRRIESAMASADRVLAYAKEQANKKSTTMYDSTKSQTAHIIKACDEAIKILTRRMTSATPKNCVPDIHDKPSFSKINHLYAETLDVFQYYPIQFPAIAQCADYLTRWFHVRVLTKYDGRALKLHCKYYRNLIPSLVILYGYYLEHGQLDVFRDIFMKFENDLKSGDCGYALPFKAFQIAKFNAGAYGNFASQLIFDYLWDYGLDALSFCEPQYGPNVRACGLRKSIITEKLMDSNIPELDAYDGDYESNLSYLDQFSVVGGELSE